MKRKQMPKKVKKLTAGVRRRLRSVQHCKISRKDGSFSCLPRVGESYKSNLKERIYKAYGIEEYKSLSVYWYVRLGMGARKRYEI